MIRLDRQSDAAAVGSLLIKLMKDAGDTASEVRRIILPSYTQRSCAPRQLLIELLTRESSAAVSYHQVVQVFKTLMAYSSGVTVISFSLSCLLA